MMYSHFYSKTKLVFKNPWNNFIPFSTYWTLANANKKDKKRHSSSPMKVLPYNFLHSNTFTRHLLKENVLCEDEVFLICIGRYWSSYCQMLNNKAKQLTLHCKILQGTVKLFALLTSVGSELNAKLWGTKLSLCV